MSESLILSLVFSATLPLMSASPPRAVRVAHNMARRLLAAELGYAEYERLRDRVEMKARLDRIPGVYGLMRMVSIGAWLFSGAR